MMSLSSRLDRWCEIDNEALAWQERLQLDAGGAVLVPVCLAHLRDRALLGLLAAWRNQHIAAFPSRFLANADSTCNWLQKNVLPGDRALLWIAPEDCDGDLMQSLGHVGVCGYREAEHKGEIELENIVRGVATSPGVMTQAMQTLLTLCEQSSIPRQMLRVFDDNAHAITFYERLGFTRGDRTPLRRHDDENGNVTMKPLDEDDDQPADEYLLTMHRSSAP